MLSFENCPYSLIKKPLSLFKHITVSLVPFVRGRSFLVLKFALQSVPSDSIRYFEVKVKTVANMVTVVEIIIQLVTCVPLLWSPLPCYCLCLFEIIEIPGAGNRCARLQLST